MLKLILKKQHILTPEYLKHIISVFISFCLFNIYFILTCIYFSTCIFSTFFVFALFLIINYIVLVSLSCSFFLYLFIYLLINWFKVVIHISYPSTFFFVLCISVVFISYSAISIYIFIKVKKPIHTTYLHISPLFVI